MSNCGREGVKPYKWMPHVWACTVQTKPHNLVETKVIRDLNPSDINKLISVSGMITRTSNVIPDLRYLLRAHLMTPLPRAWNP